MAIPRAARTQRRTRIQEEKEEQILEAALEVFSITVFAAATIDQIAEVAGMSKPNLLYYFRTKEAIHRALIDRVLDTWLDPLRAFDAEGNPESEIRSYIRRKLEMARDFPRESRLFANEVLQGAPHIEDELKGPLKAAGGREGRGDPRLGEGRQDRQMRSLSPDLLDLVDHPALCRFRRAGARRARRRTRPARGVSRMRRGFWSSCSSVA